MLKDDKKIDIEMLVFFMGVSLFSSSFYLFKHPLFYITSLTVNRRALLSIYMPDLLIVCVLIIRSFVWKKIVRNKYFLILFFPLFAFFSKGMDMPTVYIDFKPYTLLVNNFGFISFILLGYILTIIQNKLRKIHGND